MLKISYANNHVTVWLLIFLTVWLKGGTGGRAGWALDRPQLLGAPEHMLASPDRSERSEPPPGDARLSCT